MLIKANYNQQMYSRSHSMCFKKTKENETPMIQKVSKHWKNNQMKYWLIKPKFVIIRKFKNDKIKNLFS